MATITLSAGVVFALGIATGLIIEAIGIVILAVAVNKKNK